MADFYECEVCGRGVPYSGRGKPRHVHEGECAKAKQREYFQRPDVKAKQREYAQLVHDQARAYREMMKGGS